MSDRDLLVLLLIGIIAIALATLDLAYTIAGEAEKAIDATLIGAALWFFYKLGKSSRNGQD